MQEDEDSYAEYNFLTILVEGNVDLSKLAPKFSVAEDSHLYTTGSSTPEESGKSYHDFSRGPLQYTVSAEDGKSSKNYWLQILSPVGEEKFLYVNSLADPGAKAEGIYSTREVMIDSYHDNVHDILLINMGSEAINGAAVELVSDVVELDDYWTLKGELDLAGFDGVECAQLHGELGNMAKLRLRVKEGVRQGSDISGTLKIKSLTEDLLVFNLTGTIGNPGITTLEIPEAVKYVPYGTMIQNNNKYSWNRVSYSLSYGKLPEGMILKPNGEIYGVPKESGRFTFGVLLQNSGGFYNFGSHSKSFTLVVNENTNENVENATDTGYDVTTRIKDLYVNEKREDQLFVSEGIFSELVDVYLDGEKLVAGTDYRAESGSTRITIMAETLDSGLEEGTHTLGVEFRSGEDDSLKKAAQNFSVVKRSSTGGYPGGSTGGSSGSSGGDTIVTPSPTPTAEPTATTEPTATPKPTTTPKPTSTPKPTKAPEPSAAPSPLVTPKPVEEVDAGIPFIKGDEEFAGWDAIRELLKKASKGDDVVVDMNDSTLVPGEIIEEIRGKDVTIKLEMDREIAWEINGESVTSDEIPDIDFGVSLREDANEIPVEIVNKITGERYFVNMTLSHSGEFGFTAVLCINLGKENAGLYANLFYYLEDAGEMEFICADKIDKAGNARLRFTHASDYIIVVDNKIMDGVKQDGEKEDGEKNNSAGVNDKDLPKTALKDSVWFLFAGMLIILLGGAVFLVAYDKKYRNS